MQHNNIRQILVLKMSILVRVLRFFFFFFFFLPSFHGFLFTRIWELSTRPSATSTTPKLPTFNLVTCHSTKQKIKQDKKLKLKYNTRKEQSKGTQRRQAGMESSERAAGTDRWHLVDGWLLSWAERGRKEGKGKDKEMHASCWESHTHSLKPRERRRQGHPSRGCTLPPHATLYHNIHFKREYGECTMTLQSTLSRRGGTLREKLHCMHHCS